MHATARAGKIRYSQNNPYLKKPDYFCRVKQFTIHYSLITVH